MFIETKKELKEELENAEMRACRYFQKLRKIENIINESDENKELYAFTVIKIKKVLANET